MNYSLCWIFTVVEFLQLINIMAFLCIKHVSITNKTVNYSERCAGVSPSDSGLDTADSGGGIHGSSLRVVQRTGGNPSWKTPIDAFG